MNIRILAIGRCKSAPLLELCAEYSKRMTAKVKIDEIEPKKGASKDVECELLLKALKPGDIVIALDERGENMTSPELAKKIDRLKDSASTLTFIIGGADGLNDAVRARAKFLLSFGKETWPHMLVRVMLLEQIYRAQQISSGHPYHRA